MSAGIYQIRNVVNEHIYIGSSTNLDRRKKTHFNDLSKNKHYNEYLQRAYNKYGEDKFIFEILITCSPSECIQHEQQFLDQQNPDYNLSKNATKSLVGCKRSDRFRKRVSKGRKGMKFSDEHRENIRKGHLGIKPSEETKEKMRAAQRKRRSDPKDREKTSKAITKWWKERR